MNWFQFYLPLFQVMVMNTWQKKIKIELKWCSCYIIWLLISRMEFMPDRDVISKIVQRRTVGFIASIPSREEKRRNAPSSCYGDCMGYSFRLYGPEFTLLLPLKIGFQSLPWATVINTPKSPLLGLQQRVHKG